MKSPSFSLEKFSTTSITTLEADELQLITGADDVAGICSNTSDTDSKSDDCSNSNDVDNDTSGGILHG